MWVIKQSLSGFGCVKCEFCSLQKPLLCCLQAFLSSAVNSHQAVFVSCFLFALHDLSCAPFQVRILALHLPRTLAYRWTVGPAGADPDLTGCRSLLEQVAVYGGVCCLLSLWCLLPYPTSKQGLGKTDRHLAMPGLFRCGGKEWWWWW